MYQDRCRELDVVCLEKPISRSALSTQSQSPWGKRANRPVEAPS